MCNGEEINDEEEQDLLKWGYNFASKNGGILAQSLRWSVTATPC